MEDDLNEKKFLLNIDGHDHPICLKVVVEI